MDYILENNAVNRIRVNETCTRWKETYSYQSFACIPYLTLIKLKAILVTYIWQEYTKVDISLPRHLEAQINFAAIYYQHHLSEEFHDILTYLPIWLAWASYVMLRNKLDIVSRCSRHLYIDCCKTKFRNDFCVRVNGQWIPFQWLALNM